MDALNFLKERKRMCDNSFNVKIHCDSCDARHESGLCMVGFDEEAFDNTDEYFWKRAINIVEKWSREHPKETRKSKFLKENPKASLAITGNPSVCAKLLGYQEHETCGKSIQCCVECWNKEID